MARHWRAIRPAYLGLIALAALLSGCGEDSESPSPPMLRATPDAVTREIPYGINPSPQWIRVDNTGDGLIGYSARIGGGSTWLRLFGEINSTVPDSFMVSISVGGLEAGVYRDTVWIESPLAVNSPVAVPIVLTVTNLIATDPAKLVFLTVSGDPNPEPSTLTIAGASSAPFEYLLSEGASWLTLSEYAGMAPDTVEVSVDIQSLEPGTYVDSVVVSSSIAEAPISVVCTLVVASWVRDSVGASFFLRGMHFFDATTAVVVGLLSAAETDGFILRTENGGEDWSPAVSYPDEGLGAVHFADALHGWAVGARGRLLRTVDGGEFWVTGPSVDTSIGLNSVFFADALHGWTAGGGGKLYRSVDGGLNWTITATNTTSELKGLYFTDPSHGWAVGNLGTILQSADSGKTWQEYNLMASDDLWDVTFTDALTGWIVGELGVVLHTINGGQTWSEQEAPTTANLHAVTFSAGGRGWAVGDNGAIIFTADGQNWSVQPSGVTRSLFDVFFLGEDEGWICGDYGTLLHTTGGGL